MATGREIRRFPRSDQAVRSLCFAPDGKTLAAAYGPSVWLWNVATGRDRLALDHRELVNAVEFAPDGKTLVTGDNTGFICLWDTATGKVSASSATIPPKIARPRALLLLPSCRTASQS